MKKIEIFDPAMCCPTGLCGTNIDPMSIFDNIAYGPRCQGIKNKEKLRLIVEDSLKKAGLFEEVKDRLKDNALGLSGGQQQRLCIARCIAIDRKSVV